MLAAILEKDKVPDDKIFHSPVAEEGSCGLLEKACEQQKAVTEGQTCWPRKNVSVLQLSNNAVASALVKNTCDLILMQSEEVWLGLRKAVKKIFCNAADVCSSVTGSTGWPGRRQKWMHPHVLLGSSPSCMGISTFFITVSWFKHLHSLTLVQTQMSSTSNCSP